MRSIAVVLSLAGLAVSEMGIAAEQNMKYATPSAKVSVFPQEVATFFGTDDGLPTENVHSVAVTADNVVYAGTQNGLACLSGRTWQIVPGLPDKPVMFLAAAPTSGVFAVADGAVYRVGTESVAHVTDLPGKSSGVSVYRLVATRGGALVSTDRGIFNLEGLPVQPAPSLDTAVKDPSSVPALAVDHDDAITVAGSAGLYRFANPSAQEGSLLHVSDGKRSWALYGVAGLVFDTTGRLWFASLQGAGCCNSDGSWSLYTGEDGLPYNEFTAIAAGEEGVVWFGTTMGAIRFDGRRWSYRQGRRWLPDDRVNAIAVDRDGNAWIATPKGISLIERKPMTLRQKAKFYEDEIDKRHRRTEYGYVLEVRLKKAGDKSEWVQSDSDNDGLWTSMYGAGECFAYGATKQPEAKKRAKAAFEALRFLNVVTQGGNPPALPGFVARTVLPTSGPNPNEKDYTPEKDKQSQKGDKLWKVISPRWPTSADGKWYWKCDTSSDELDGHYFFYAQYYDLVADTEEEKQRVRDLVKAITDHLVDHDFCLVDWDGKPTRWAVYGPRELNHNPFWAPERGLNSLSILSYLSVAEHITGDAKYRDAFDMLVREHGYAMNMMVPKMQTGPGSGNQSDDEMAFMSFYNLIRYSHDPVVRDMARIAFKNYWSLEEPELDPFFNFTYAGVSLGSEAQDAYNTLDLSPKGPWLEQSIETLERFPLDRIDWRHTNSRRIDVVPLSPQAREAGDKKAKGSRRDGRVIPVDETHFNHWNYDPWELDVGGNGSGLADGAVFLLPYYMGLHHGFIAEEGANR